MAFAPEVFRDRLSPQADFTVIRDALMVPQPPDDADPHTKISWVASTIDGVTEGQRYARLGTGFGAVYGRLSGNIRDNLSDFSQQEALGRASVIFVGYWLRPTDACVRYLTGDDSALDDMTLPWRQSQLDCEVKNAPIGLETGLGVNTHIVSRDLGKSVFEAFPPEAYYSDYKEEVKNKISATVDELSGAFIPGHPYVRLRIAGALKRMIASGRDYAWDASVLAKETDAADEQEMLWQRMDIQAAKNNVRIKRNGGVLLSLARMTEQLPGSWPNLSAGQRAS